MKNLLIFGASGQGKVVADIAVLSGKYEKIAFLDDDKNKKAFGNFEILGDIQYAIHNKDEFEVIVAIGNNEIRRKIQLELEKQGVSIATLIHPDAVIAKGVFIGEGSVVVAGAVVNPGAVIGKGCIVNTCSSVDHDSVVGDFVHISVGAHITGTVNVGDNTFVGAGATVINNINVCDNCIIGAGATVVENITETGTYVGVPARRIGDIKCP